MGSGDDPHLIENRSNFHAQHEHRSRIAGGSIAWHSHSNVVISFGWIDSRPPQGESMRVNGARGTYNQVTLVGKSSDRMTPMMSSSVYTLKAAESIKLRSPGIWSK